MIRPPIFFCLWLDPLSGFDSRALKTNHTEQYLNYLFSNDQDTPKPL